MNIIKKIKEHNKKISGNVFLFDEEKDIKLEYNRQLPKNIFITDCGESNIVKVHSNIKARNIKIYFSPNTKNCSCILDDSGDSAGLDIEVIFLDGEKSELKIGKRTGMNGTKIWLGNGSKCFIGDDCRFSYEIIIRTTDGHTIIDNETKEIINNQKCPCIIGNSCWIGLRSIINKNVQLPNDTIVGSGSVVTGQFDKPYTIIAGNPAKIIKEGVKHNRENIYMYTKRNSK